MTDTGAGTPLTAEEEAARLVDIIEQAIFETDTGLEAALLASDRILAVSRPTDDRLREQWAEHQTALAARSRPATDPAGLRQAINKALDYLADEHPSEMALAAARATLIAARLSVADGPGPEERP